MHFCIVLLPSDYVKTSVRTQNIGYLFKKKNLKKAGGESTCDSVALYLQKTASCNRPGVVVDVQNLLNMCCTNYR